MSDQLDRRGRTFVPASLKPLSIGLFAVAATTAAFATTAAPAVADDCANAQYRTGASAGLPDCRAYEQVSPRVKFGQGVWYMMPVPKSTSGSIDGALPGWAADDGDTVLFTGSGSATAPEPVRGFGAYPQSARRTSEGWTSRVIPGSVRPETVFRGSSISLLMPQPNSDRTGVLFTSSALLVPEQPVGDVGQSPAVMFATADSTSWLSRPPWAGASPPPSAPEFANSDAVAPVGQSDDGSTFFFMTRQVLTPEDAASGRTWADNVWALYRWKDGVVRNAGILPDGDIDPVGSMSPGLAIMATGATGPSLPGINANNVTTTLGSTNVVSRDGRRALFLGIGSGNVSAVPQLYLYREGQPTLLLSKRADTSDPVTGSDGVVPIGMYDAAQNSNHNVNGNLLLSAVADRDLDAVVFSTRDALTDDAPSALNVIKTYRYTVATGDLEYLDDLNRPWGSGSPRRSAGNVVRMSDEGTRLLFWTPDGKLKLWRAGASTLELATGFETSGAISIKGARFSDDARTVIFQSTRAIAGEADHPAGNSPLQTQVYRFEEGVDAVPRCVSCPPIGAATRGPATFSLTTPYFAGFGSFSSNTTAGAESRSISADGRRVYFTTTSTLDPRDQNAAVDVYEWSADRDSVALLSSGAAASKGSGLLDVDASGNNVFLVTMDPLTASDTDDIADLYVARVGGGLPDPTPLFVGDSWCAQTGCQGAAGAGPRLPVVGSVGFAGRGNVSLPAGASVRVSALKTVVGSVTRLRVRVPGAGRISVAGASIRRTGKPASKAGSYSVRVALSSKARKSLKKKKKLRVGVRVSYRSRDGRLASKTMRVTFKQPLKRSIKSKQGGR